MVLLWYVSLMPTHHVNTETILSFYISSCRRCSSWNFILQTLLPDSQEHCCFSFFHIQSSCVNLSFWQSIFFRLLWICCLPKTSRSCSFYITHFQVLQKAHCRWPTWYDDQTSCVHAQVLSGFSSVWCINILMKTVCVLPSNIILPFLCVLRFYWDNLTVGEGLKGKCPQGRFVHSVILSTQWNDDRHRNVAENRASTNNSQY